MTEQGPVLRYEQILKEGFLAHPRRYAAASVGDLELFQISIGQLFSGHWREFLACTGMTIVFGLAIKQRIEKTGKEILKGNAKP